MSSARDGSAWTRPVVGAVALVCLGLLRHALGTGSTGIAVDALLALAAAAATFEASRRASPGRSRAGWRLQTAGATSWVVAALAWLLGLPEVVAIVARAGLVVCFAAGWWLTSRGVDPWSRVRLVIDSAMAGASVFVASWHLGLGAVIARDGGDPVTAVAVGLPFGALAVAALATGVAFTEMHPDRRRMPLLVVTGLLVVVASDLLHVLGGTPVWAVGFAFLVLATRAYRGTSQRREVMSTRRALVFAPYAILAPTVVSLVVHQVRDGGLAAVEAGGAVVVAGLLLARQHVTLLENRNLVLRLARTERRLRHQATHDSLTGLPSRVVLSERLDEALDRRRATGEEVAVVFLDLDDFKEVNDSYGHASGDEVLVETARRLRLVLEPYGEHAVAARMSGDEFAALLVGDAALLAPDVARQLLGAVVRPYVVGEVEVRVGGSVGVALAVEPGTDGSALLRAADVAMYDVKHHGKGGVRVAGGEPVAGLR